MNSNVANSQVKTMEMSQKFDNAMRIGEKDNRNLQNSLTVISQDLKDLGKSISHANRQSDEITYAEIFKSTIEDSKWMTNKTFSPGRWAVGYQVLYVLYRILNEIRPQTILEIGLGQSTRMIAQYVEASPEVYHRVVEHDSSWIDFFSKQYALSPRSQIVQLDWDFINYNGAANVRCYRDFSAQFNDQRFDLILIDGPLGGT